MKFSFKDWRFRLFIFLLIPVGLYGIYSPDFFMKKSIEFSEPLLINPDDIKEIEIRDGRWKWTDTEWKMNQSTILRFDDRGEIINICHLISQSKPRYISDIQGVNGFLTLRLHRTRFLGINLTLKSNLNGETFFEFGSNTYDGTELGNQLRRLGDKYGVSRNSLPE